MITSLQLASVATFPAQPVEMADLKIVNYIFGGNGSGKTTISRLIADPTRPEFTASNVRWKINAPLERLVYNSDFVDREFDQSESLKGVFTLGSEQKDALQSIEKLKAEISELKKEVAQLETVLQGEDGHGGKQAALESLETDFASACWKIKQKYDTHFEGPFKGTRHQKKAFAERVLSEKHSNSAELQSLSSLITRADTLFKHEPVNIELIPLLDTGSLQTGDSLPLLQRKLVGKEDIAIAALIKQLGNSDWVRQGISFLKETQSEQCPFCQQPTDSSLVKELEEFFDQEFQSAITAIQSAYGSYKEDAATVRSQLSALVESDNKFLDAELISAQAQALSSLLDRNTRIFEDKLREPSKSLALSPLSEAFDKIESAIAEANEEVDNHNLMIQNLYDERKALTRDVWRFIINELDSTINTYLEQHSNCEKAIQNIKDALAARRVSIATNESRIKEHEKLTTSIQPTIDGINSILASFGFTSFSLQKSADEMGYILARHDSSDAKATLSEGERNFVSFLYFFHLLKGSTSEHGQTNDRVVVIDDPVSSLDSEVLFVVSSLIRSIIEEATASTGFIKQVFVLTHNVYFHKEVSFNLVRPSDTAMTSESFWLVRKKGHASAVERCETNFIKSSYELLWNEVRSPQVGSATLQNTLRRILESYFKLLGGIDYKSILSNFQGNEFHICRALLSWVHSGSHGAQDDLFVSTGGSDNDAYLSVFRKIFENEGHLSHYKMMMGEHYKEDEDD